MYYVLEINDGFGVYVWYFMEVLDKGVGFLDFMSMCILDDVIISYEYWLGMESIGEGYGSNVKG